MHVKSEYDYQFESDFRKEIFDAFKYVYYKENKINLSVYGVPDRLKDYATSKKDISNGVEVNPREEFRLHKEDIYPDIGGAGSTSGTQYSSNSGGSSGSNGYPDEV